MTPEQRKEHLRKVAEKLKQERELEAQKDREYYEKITSGTRWMIFKIGMVFCILLAIVTTIDTFVDGKTEKLHQDQFVFDRSLGAWDYQSVWVNENDIFLVHFSDMVGMNLNTFELTKSFITGDNKYISFIQEYEDSVTPMTRTRIKAQKRVSIYEWFPFVQVLLLLPLLVFLFRKQKPWFKFAQFASLLLIMPGSVILLLTLIF